MNRRRLIAVTLPLLMLLAWALWPASSPPAAPASPAPTRQAATPDAPRAGEATAASRRSRPSPRLADAADAAPPPPPMVRVPCPLPPDAVADADRFRSVWTSINDLPAGYHAVHVTGDTLLRAPEGTVSGQGWFDIPGWSRIPFTVTPGPTGPTCALGQARRAAAITGRVRTPQGVEDDRIMVAGCGGRARTDSDGGFFFEADAEPCTVRAIRRDGLLTVRSAPVEIQPGAGQDVVIDLDLPAFRAAGVGTVLQEAEGGVTIQRVLTGGPAAEAGLLPGDLVIALDGEDVSGWSTDEFVDVAIGAEGTEVTYTVLRDGERVDIRMVRQPIDKDG